MGEEKKRCKIERKKDGPFVVMKCDCNGRGRKHGCDVADGYLDYMTG